MGKIFSKGTSDKGLLSRVHDEHLKLKIRKQSTQLKYGPKTLRDTSSKKIYR